jgi:4,5-dihydroxyphthalate decarboxylase
LLKGKVEVNGVDLTILTDMDSATRHWRFLNKGEFDIAEVSASSYLAARDNDLPFRAIPVFLHRRFRHGFMFINTSKGIKKPADLKGRRIGVKTMMTTAVLWMRGILQSEYGVPLNSIDWVAEIEDDVKVSLPQDIKYSCLPNDKSVDTMLAEGELDAVLHSDFVKPSSPGIRAWRVSSPTTRRKRWAISSAPASFQSCTSSACASRSRTTIHGSPSIYSGPLTKQRRSR